MNDNIPKVGDKFLVGVSPDSPMVLLEKLNERRFKELDKAYHNISEINRYFRMAHEFFFNWEEYNLVINKNLDLMLNRYSDMEYGEMVLIDVNRVVNNIVSSFNFFVKRTEEKIKSRYGDSSIIYRDVKGILKEAYDKYFEYRFFYHMRNFIQHDEYFADRVEYRSDQVSGNSMIIPFVNNITLQNAKSIKKVIQSELRMYNDSFPLDPLLNKLFSVVEKVSDRILMRISKEYIHDIEEVYSLRLKYPDYRNVGFGEVNKVIASETIDYVIINPYLLPLNLVKIIKEYKYSD